MARLAIAVVACLAIVGSAYQIWSERAQVRATENALRLVGIAINMYSSENASIPPSLQALVPGFIMAGVPLTDGWGRQLQYRASPTGMPQPFALTSLGKDGVANSGDDVDFWTIKR